MTETALTSSRIEEIVRASSLARELSPRAGAMAGVVSADSAEVVSLGTGVGYETPMQIGSLTKIFTALLLADAVRRGEVELAAPIDQLLFGEPWHGSKAITVEELATHTSGLPRLSFGRWRALQADPYRGYTQAALLRYLEQTQPRIPERRAYRYSNLGYAVLGLVLEKAASLPFEQLLLERLLRSLGMAHTGLQLTGGGDMASGGFTSSGAQASLWHMDAYAPCGAMISTLEDLMRAARNFLNAQSPIAALLELTTEPRAAAPGGSVGLAWMLPAAGNSFWHNGGTAGYSSFLGMNSKQKLGVIVLANQGIAQTVTELGVELMRYVRGETQEPAKGESWKL